MARARKQTGTAVEPEVVEAEEPKGKYDEALKPVMELSPESEKDVIVSALVASRDAGASLPAISKALNESGIPPFRSGKEFRPQVVRSIVLAAKRREEKEGS
jgi:hypothetical protein